MNWQQIITDVRDAYRSASNSNQPISQVNYLEMLNAFRMLVPLASISEAYDTDFRRNLPGGGLRGFEVPPLLQRIDDAETFAKMNDLYSPAGEGVAENIRAIIQLVPPNTASKVLAPLIGTLQKILNGSL